MSSNKINILFTGYIGGSVLARLLEHPKFPTFNIGSYTDEPFLEKLASESDVVIATSGTGVLIDDAKGMYPGETIYDDSNPDQIETLAPTPECGPGNCQRRQRRARQDLHYPSKHHLRHRKQQTGRFRASEPLSLQAPELIRAALDQGYGGTVGEGKNIWPDVNVEKVADLYIKLFDAILTNQNPGHGREGFYFGENGEHTLYDVGKRISESLVELGLGNSLDVKTFTQEDLDKYFGGNDYLGTNSRCIGKRSRALGWKPLRTTKDFFESIKLEVEVLANLN